MNADKKSVDELTERVIGCAMMVSNSLGCGFLEKVYENALAHELRKHGLCVQQQIPIEVSYDGVAVGVYVADLIVNDLLVLELKAARAIDDAHVAQCINFLKACGKSIGLILNFGTPRLQIKRLVHNL